MNCPGCGNNIIELTVGKKKCVKCSRNFEITKRKTIINLKPKTFLTKLQIYLFFMMVLGVILNELYKNNLDIKKMGIRLAAISLTGIALIYLIEALATGMIAFPRGDNEYFSRKEQPIIFLLGFLIWSITAIAAIYIHFFKILI